jgi:hypothetical protein
MDTAKRRASFLWFLCMLLGWSAVTRLEGADKSVVVGVNVYDEGSLSQPDQDAEIERLAKDGVKTIRTGLGANSLYFITQAFRHDIGSIVIIFPTYGSKAKTKLRWSDAPLSGADPQGFTEWLKPVLNQLEAAGVRLTAMELGNEINTSGYNGDIPMPGTGRVLGLADLNNPKDPEGPAIAAGFRNYLRVMAALKELRDQSKVNKKTPVILAGLADWGLPSPKAWDKNAGVSLPDTIDFLRQNGLDKLVDGYGVHVYPTGDSKASVAARVSELEKKKIFSECRHGKPCWLTEWGIANNQSCPIDDSKRTQAITAERSALSEFVQQERLAAIVYYTWSGTPGKVDPMGVFRCGALTGAGKAAIRPM